jgi:ribosomal protein L40E
MNRSADTSHSPPSKGSGPKASAGAAARRYEIAGEDLVVEIGAPMPDVCLKCGAVEGVTHEQRAFGSDPLDLVLCRRCGARWRRALLNLGMLGALLAFAAVVWCVFVVLFVKGPAGVKIVAAGAAFVLYPLFYVRYWLMLRKRMLQARSAAAGKVALRGVHPDAIARLARG